MKELLIPSFESWSAIAMAIFVGFVVQLMLNLFGLSLGLTALRPTEGQGLSVADIPKAAMLWWLFSALLSFVATGFVVGWLCRSRGVIDTAIFGTTVWALSAIFAVWFAMTVIGSWIGGAFSLLVAESTRSPRPVELVLNVEPRQQPPSGADQRATVRVAPSKARRDGMVAGLTNLSWIAVMQAAKQLEDPEVRATIRRIALSAWDDLSTFRQSVMRELDRWIEETKTSDESAKEALQSWLVSVLLIDPETAREIVEGWQDRLSKVARSKSQASADSGLEEAQPDLAARIEALKKDVADSMMQVRRTVDDLFGSGGALGPDERREAVDAIRDALAITEARAELVLARWETRSRAAYRELTRMSEKANQQAVELTEASLEAGANAAALAGLSLLFGWVASVAGTFVGARLPNWLAA
jgi:hypothetical protein